ncbi:carbonic anhydrase [Butyriboletus roseoflavus]|nr:carbonic anhydrase [Butyriboletus roseoflavus]
MIPPYSPIHTLLDANVRWANAVDLAEPGFFRCADSRVPETVLTGARPGDIFVHRNIANQFHPDDDSALAVLSYALGVVGVEHVVLAGHTQCGGAVACYDAFLARSTTSPEDTLTPLSRWLAPLSALVASLDLSNTPTTTALDLIVQENVKRQVEHISAADPIQQAWAAGKPVCVHGWVYDIASGRIKDLGVSRGPGVSA